MLKLRKLLVDKTKIQRHQRILLNIHITVPAWLVESISYIMGSISVFLSQQNNITRGLQSFAGLIYFVAVPGVYLVNNGYTKSAILDNKLYLALINNVFPSSVQEIAPNDDIIDSAGNQE